MNRLGSIMEGLILFVLGAYGGLLVFLGDYWRYLNPKFMKLTGAAAIMLMITGVAALFNPARKARPSRIIVFLLFLGLITFGVFGSAFLPGSRTASQGDEAANLPPRVTVDGREYTRINLAELYQLGEKPESEESPKFVAVRGFVQRSEELDSQGQFAILRTAVFCCLADSVAMGFRVRYDRVKELADGQWVEMYATFERSPKKLPAPALRVQGITLVVLSKSALLVPSKTIPIDEPEIPYIFDIREHEPFAY